MRTPQVLQIESLKSLGFLVLLRPRLLRATEIDVLAVAVRVGVVPLVSEGYAVVHGLAIALELAVVGDLTPGNAEVYCHLERVKGAGDDGKEQGGNDDDAADNDQAWEIRIQD